MLVSVAFVDVMSSLVIIAPVAWQPSNGISVVYNFFFFYGPVINCSVLAPPPAALVFEM